MVLKMFIKKFKILLCDTKGEYTACKDKTEYIINGVKYTVFSRYEQSGYTLKDRLKNYLKSDFADLTSEPKNNILEPNYVCSTAGKED